MTLSKALPSSAAHSPAIRPSLMERLISRLPMPFWVSSVFLALFFGPPGFILYRYLDTGEPVNDILVAYFHGLLPSGLPRQVIGLVLWTLLFYSSLVIPRYMRIKIQQAEEKISPLAPDGKEGYRCLFLPLSYAAPPILLAVVIAVSFASFISAALEDIGGPLEWVYQLVNLPLTYLAVSSTIWSYFAALWGLYLLGKQPLSLKPAYEDSSLGVKPIGSLSLSISYGYFGLIALTALITIFNPVIYQLGILLVILIGLGLAMFLLPLLGVHRQMLKVKRALLASIRQQWLPILKAMDASAALPGTEATLDELRLTLAGVQNIMTLEAAERKANAVSTWPFDTTILGKLAAISLSILVAIISSRIIKLLDLLTK